MQTISPRAGRGAGSRVFSFSGRGGARGQGALSTSDVSAPEELAGAQQTLKRPALGVDCPHPLEQVLEVPGHIPAHQYLRHPPAAEPAKLSLPPPFLRIADCASLRMRIVCAQCIRSRRGGQPSAAFSWPGCRAVPQRLIRVLLLLPSHCVLSCFHSVLCAAVRQLLYETPPTCARCRPQL